MSPDSRLRELISQIVGGRLAFVRFAANSLLLYVDCEPGDEQGVVIWLEPYWRVAAESGVIVDAVDAQGQTGDGASRDELDALWELLQPLLGHVIDEVEVSPATFDLAIAVQGGYRMETTTELPADGMLWSIRDFAAEPAVYADETGLHVHSPRA